MMIKKIGINYAGNVLRALISIAVNVLLARFIAPSQFGIAAICLSVVSVGNLLVDSGFGASLIHDEEITDDKIGFALYQQFRASLIAYAVISIACLLGLYFSKSEVYVFLPLFSLSIFFFAISQISTSLLKRKLNFEFLQIAQIVSYLVGFCLPAIILSVLGFGLVSLIIGQIMQSIVYFAMVYLKIRHSFRFRTAGSSEAFNYSLGVLKTNFVNWGISNVDTLIVGILMGNTSTGLYNRSSQLSIQPVNLLIGSFQNVLFPLYSRKVSSKQALLKTVGFLSFSIGSALIPIFLIAYLNGEVIINLIYGQAWVLAIPIFKFMLLAMPFMAASSMIGPLLWSIGKVEKELIVSMWIFVTMVISYGILSRHGLYFIGIAYIGINIIRMFGMCWQASTIDDSVIIRYVPIILIAQYIMSFALIKYTDYSLLGFFIIFALPFIIILSLYKISFNSLRVIFSRRNQ